MMCIFNKDFKHLNRFPQPASSVGLPPESQGDLGDFGGGGAVRTPGRDQSRQDLERGGAATRPSPGQTEWGMGKGPGVVPGEGKVVTP